MRKKTDIDRLYDKLHIPPEGRRIVEQIRHSPPERATGGGRHNIHGFYPSRKMGCTIQFESNSCELGYVVRAEFDASVREFYCQPHALKHVYPTKSGKKTAHYEIADYLEISETDMSFISCKTEAELLELSSENPNRYVRDESGKWRCPPGEAAAAEYGLGFRVVSSAEFNPCFLQNLEFLGDYLQERTAPQPATIEAVNTFFAERSFGNLTDLIERTGSADEVYRAIVTGHLYFEWESAFLSQTHSTMVFRDCVSAKAYRCVMNHRYFDPAPQIETLVLKPGHSVTWDGVAWEVLNIGDDTITLAHAKNVAPLSKPHFFELVNAGHIKGAVIERDPRFDAAKERLLTASPLAMDEAWRRYNIIAPKLGNAVLEIHEAEDDSTPDRTVREYMKLWKDGEAVYLDGFTGLIPDYADQGNRNRKLPARTIELAKKVIRKYWLKEKAPVKQNNWLRFKKIARRLGVQFCSDKTYYGLFKEVRIEEATEARHGHKAAYQVAGPLWDGDPELFAKHGDRVFAVAHIDHTEVDLELVSSVTRVNLGKAWLTLLIDAYSREVLACYLSFDRPSYVACMMAMRICVARHGRLPDVIVSDQGKEFRGRCFRRLAARHSRTLKYRPPSEPRFGSIVERAFGSLNTRLIHNLEGNTQNSKKPRESAKSHAPPTHAVWTVPKFMPHLERFVYDVLPTLDHFGLLRTPREIFEESFVLHGLRESRRIVYSEAFIFDTLPTPQSERKKVHGRKGITVNYLTYWSRELRDPKVIGTKVPVRFDPFDAGHIWAYAKGRWIRCECTSTLFRGIPVGEVMWAVTQIKADARRTRRNYRINTQTLEDFFFTLMREENALVAEKKRIRQAMQATYPTHDEPDERVDQPGAPEIDTDNAPAPIHRTRKPLKSVHVKNGVTTA